MTPEVGLEKVTGLQDTPESLRYLESLRIEQEVQIEREWWKDSIIDDSDQALKNSVLVEVPVEGLNYRVVKALRTGKEPCLLRPGALNLLNEIEEGWRKKCVNSVLDFLGVFLSITSLYRDENLQREIQKSSYLASQRASSHRAGAAIDIDPNGYYFSQDKKFLNLNAKQEGFNPAYILALKEVLAELESEARCHVIYEKGFKQSGGDFFKFDICYHVCLNPNCQMI